MGNVVRAVCAVIVAILVWFTVATVGNLALRAVIPGYASVEGTMTFTLPMQIGRLVLGIVSSFCAGVVCAAIARSNWLPVQIAASIMVILFLPVHYSLWAKFPVWYHVFFLITLVPAVLLGARLWQRRSTVL